MSEIERQRGPDVLASNRQAESRETALERESAPPTARLGEEGGSWVGTHRTRGDAKDDPGSGGHDISLLNGLRERVGQMRSARATRLLMYHIAVSIFFLVLDIPVAVR